MSHSPTRQIPPHLAPVSIAPPLSPLTHPMSTTPAHQLAREFAICVSLSFIVVLGVIHGLPHLTHALIASGPAPLARFLATPAAHIAQISHIHEHLLVVFKITVACCVLVFALREIVAAVGSLTGWWDVEGQDEEEDLEVGDKVERWGEKRSHLRGIPYPNNTVIF
ncbi:hypothetical protein MVEN_00301200 [Mycena venus]|uniref:Uncharacterized protein n=1 Tax=Mycena venus TaxID=2733690 RepID=A0A8H6Z2X3_9AGAR|nr:hypothetical protein MVEN_00301200 [Mycena venus]